MEQLTPELATNSLQTRYALPSLRYRERRVAAVETNRDDCVLPASIRGSVCAARLAPYRSPCDTGFLLGGLLLGLRDGEMMEYRQACVEALQQARPRPLIEIEGICRRTYP